MRDIEIRKIEHILICEYCDVTYKKTNLLEDIELIHRGIGGIDFDEIDTSVKIFGRKLDAPIIITAITGGFSKAKEINSTIAEVCEELNIGMEVGSQKIGLKNPESFEIIKEYDILRIGNLGAVDVMNKFNEDIILKCVEMIDAHAFSLHFNPLQEVIQPEGDKNFSNLNKISEVIKNYKEKYGNLEFIAKQVGEGFCKEDAKILKEIGFDAINVGGSGGTSFAKVEYYRRRDENIKIFCEWGIPTALSLFEVKNYFDKIIASGGIRNGIEIVKCLVIGAKVCGIALPVLKCALKGRKYLKEYLEKIIEQIKITMFLVGAKNTEELRKVNYLIKGELKDYLRQRGLYPRV